MREPFPDFTAAELAEVRRMNRRLRWAPRFRAPTPLGRLMIQTMLGAQADHARGHARRSRHDPPHHA